MAKTLSATFKASVYYSHVNTDALSVQQADANTDQYSLSLTSGTGASGTGDLKYSNLYTLAASATQDIDLSGSVTDAFGATIAFARIKCIHIRVLSTTDDATSLGGPVDVGGAASNQFINWIGTAATKVRIGGAAGRGGCFHLSCDDATGYAVTAATGDLLRITNVSGTLSVKVAVVLIGASA